MRSMNGLTKCEDSNWLRSKDAQKQARASFDETKRNSVCTRCFQLNAQLSGMTKSLKVVFIVYALTAVRALQLIDPNLLPYDYPEWTQVRLYRKLHLLFQLKGLCDTIVNGYFALKSEWA